MNSFEKEFVIFVAESERSPLGQARRHFRFEEMTIYMRIGRRFYGGKVRPCLQIASLSTDEDHQRKGIFSRFLACVLGATKLPIFIEGVIDPGFADALVRRGFVIVTNYDGFQADLVLDR